MRPQRAMRTFWIIWLGQLFSLIGSGLSAFAFGIWVYQRSGSVAQFALVTLLNTLPAVLLGPLAGSLADRWDRRWLMILSDGGSGVVTLILAALLLGGGLELWHIYLGILLSAAFGVFQWPAYSAAVTMLVPREDLARASGIIQASYAISQLLAPVLAGALIGLIGLRGIVLIDAITFALALISLLAVRIPPPPPSAVGEQARRSWRSEALFGWRYILSRPGLLALTLFVTITNYCIGAVEVLLAPLVLGFASETVLGAVLSASGCGMLVGSVLMGVWGGPQRRVAGLLLFTALQGLALVAGALRPSAVAVGVAAFVFLFCSPVIIGAVQALWQSKVEPDVQGRVFAARSMLTWTALPLAYSTIGLVADRFEPLLAPGGPLAASAGVLLGVGPGRGVALLIMGLGGLMIAVALAGAAHPRLRVLEDELPDIVPPAEPRPPIEQPVSP